MQRRNLEKWNRASLEVSIDSKKLDCQLGQHVEERASLQLVASLNMEHNYTGKVALKV